MKILFRKALIVSMNSTGSTFYYWKSYSKLSRFPWISVISENRKIFEKIFEKSPGREFYFFILSKATQNRKLFFTTLSFGNQDFSSIWSWFLHQLLQLAQCAFPVVSIGFSLIFYHEGPGERAEASESMEIQWKRRKMRVERAGAKTRACRTVDFCYFACKHKISP